MTEKGTTKYLRIYIQYIKYIMLMKLLEKYLCWSVGVYPCFEKELNIGGVPFRVGIPECLLHS